MRRVDVRIILAAVIIETLKMVLQKCFRGGKQTDICSKILYTLPSD